MAIILTIDLIQKTSKHKMYPKVYEEPIVQALLMYPELKNVDIEFRMVKRGTVPYNTKPTFSSIFKPAAKRKYVVRLLDKAKGTDHHALFKNLSRDEQIAVIAHELVHVVQFQRCSVPKLIKMLALYPFPAFRRKFERGADKGAIEHGFGDKLHKHAVYLRKIPGYLKNHPEINKYYLRPDEILSFIRKRELNTSF